MVSEGEYLFVTQKLSKVDYLEADLCDPPFPLGIIRHEGEGTRGGEKTVECSCV